MHDMHVKFIIDNDHSFTSNLLGTIKINVCIVVYFISSFRPYHLGITYLRGLGFTPPNSFRWTVSLVGPDHCHYWNWEATGWLLYTSLFKMKPEKFEVGPLIRGQFRKMSSRTKRSQICVLRACGLTKWAWKMNSFPRRKPWMSLSSSSWRCEIRSYYAPMS